MGFKNHRLSAVIEGQVKRQFSKYLGLDVLEDTIAVSVAESDGGEIANLPARIEKLVRQLRKHAAALKKFYGLLLLPVSKVSADSSAAAGGH